MFNDKGSSVEFTVQKGDTCNSMGNYLASNVCDGVNAVKFIAKDKDGKNPVCKHEDSKGWIAENGGLVFKDIDYYFCTANKPIGPVNSKEFTVQKGDTCNSMGNYLASVCEGGVYAIRFIAKDSEGKTLVCKYENEGWIAENGGLITGDVNYYSCFDMTNFDL